MSNDKAIVQLGLHLASAGLKHKKIAKSESTQNCDKTSFNSPPKLATHGKNDNVWDKVKWLTQAGGQLWRWSTDCTWFKLYDAGLAKFLLLIQREIFWSRVGPILQKCKNSTATSYTNQTMYQQKFHSRITLRPLLYKSFGPFSLLQYIHFIYHSCKLSTVCPTLYVSIMCLASFWNEDSSK